MTPYHPRFDGMLRRLVREGFLDEAIGARLNKEPSAIYRRRVKLGLLAKPCKRIPWQDALDRKTAVVKRLREEIIS